MLQVMMIQVVGYISFKYYFHLIYASSGLLSGNFDASFSLMPVLCFYPLVLNVKVSLTMFYFDAEQSSSLSDAQHDANNQVRI